MHQHVVIRLPVVSLEPEQLALNEKGPFACRKPHIATLARIVGVGDRGCQVDVDVWMGKAGLLKYQR